MIGWLIFGLYAIGYVLAWRRIAWFIANVEVYVEIDGADIAFGIVFGAFLSLFWPLIVPVYYLHRSGLLMSGRHALLKAPKHVRDKERIEAQKRRIAELEREVGLR